MKISEYFCCPPEKAHVQTVQSVSGINGLNNCFVHVIDNNTVYYVDNKHHITEICVGIVEVKDYDFDTNPLGLRNQVAYDTKQATLYYFDNMGKPHAFDPNLAIDFNQLVNRPQYNGEVMTGNTNIPKVPTEISDLTDGQRVTDLENQVKDLEAAGGTPDLDVVVGQGAVATASTVQITAPTQNLKTGATSLITTPFPIASETQAGAISASDYAQFKAGGGSQSPIQSVGYGLSLTDTTITNALPGYELLNTVTGTITDDGTTRQSLNVSLPAGYSLFKIFFQGAGPTSGASRFGITPNNILGTHSRTSAVTQAAIQNFATTGSPVTSTMNTFNGIGEYEVGLPTTTADTYVYGTADIVCTPNFSIASWEMGMELDNAQGSGSEPVGALRVNGSWRMDGRLSAFSLDIVALASTTTPVNVSVPVTLLVYGIKSS